MCPSVGLGKQIIAYPINESPCLPQKGQARATCSKMRATHNDKLQQVTEIGKSKLKKNYRESKKDRILCNSHYGMGVYP